MLFIYPPRLQEVLGFQQTIALWDNIRLWSMVFIEFCAKNVGGEIHFSNRFGSCLGVYFPLQEIAELQVSRKIFWFPLYGYVLRSVLLLHRSDSSI